MTVEKMLLASFPLQRYISTVKENVWIEVQTDRPDAIYKVGETVDFRVGVVPNAPSHVNTLSWTMTLDGATVLNRGIISLRSGSAIVAGALDQPGILRLTVTPDASADQLGVGIAGAAFDPFQIEATAQLPPDFGDFWGTQRDELAKIPIDPQLERVHQANSDVEVFDFSLASVDGIRVRGYFARPKGLSPLPAILTLPGMGVRSASLKEVVKMATEGFIAFDLNNHDVPNGRPPEFYKKLGADGLLCYPLQGREDRHTYFYRRMILGALRALDYIVSRADWNRQMLIVSGFSEGGALSLMTAGLDARITKVFADVPTLCEQSGVAFGRPAGNPRLVRINRDGRPDAKLLEVAGYYDSCNFARFIKAPVTMNVGLIDPSSPPMTCLSAYNLISGSKTVYLGARSGHGGSPLFHLSKERFFQELADATIKAMQQSSTINARDCVATPMKPTLRKIFSDLLGIPIEGITDDTSPENTPEWDSLQSLNLVITLEETFSIRFPVDEMLAMQSLGKVRELLRLKGVEIDPA